QSGFIRWRLAYQRCWMREDMAIEGVGCMTLQVVDPEATSPTSTPATYATLPSAPAIVTPAVPATVAPTVTPLALVDTECQLTTLQSVNFRAAPNTDAQRIGSALTDTALEADGQFKGSAGFTWWRLVDGQGWVRE